MKIAGFVGALLLVSAPAFAHVGITPREAKLGATESYTLRVPSEGGTMTTSFVAKNPAEGESITWKVHQKYLDGMSSDWVGAPGTRAPAPVTKLVQASW